MEICIAECGFCGLTIRCCGHMLSFLGGGKTPNPLRNRVLLVLIMDQYDRRWKHGKMSWTPESMP